MKTMLALTLVALLLAPSLALDLGTERPAKPPIQHPHQPGEPDRQGGDVIADAVPLTLPAANITGSTVGYTDDYDEVCPYTQSTSPDVVYSLNHAHDAHVTIDMLGSTYDTKIYVYDETMDLVACNDDFYPDYVSRIENLELFADVTYYLIIDGYGGDAGDYVLNIVEFCAPVILCPPGAELEGEPELVDGYEDSHNGGCQYPEFGYNFGTITQQIFCGVSGWFFAPGGGQTRDIDYFEVILPESGVLEITADAEHATYVFEQSPPDCADGTFVQSIVVGPANEASMTITGAPGSPVWVVVIPTIFDGEGEYNYIMETNLDGLVATEAHSWSEVKTIFR